MNKQTGFGIPMALAMVFLSNTFLIAQDVTTVSATNESIGDHLDLEAVASLFGDAKDLEDFEKRLNDPKTQISNLDLNGDFQVDYLRVVETVEEGTHLVALQAVVGEDLYQDVATIEVEKDEDGATQVQVVGDVYLYGPNYIIEPVYVRRPVIFVLFWRPYYRPYRSVFYWGHYPRFYRFWSPFGLHTYHKHVHVHINRRHSFHRVHVRKSVTAVHIHTRTRRNDYGRKYPQRSYAFRTTGTVQTGKRHGVAGVNQADGDKYRAAGVQKADGTTKKIAGVNKADGTKKRVASVEKADGSRKTVAVKKDPNGNKKAISVSKSADGKRSVKTGKSTSKKSKAKKTSAKAKRSAKKTKTKSKKKKG
ncbi:hypothetical protein WIW50_11200 [Flavobacteriaceae bacterium 3-367]|uniref:hypothetical protein n=1 Tax=Eudoraea algarum TaxID=3417568 RepID=UPI0032748D6D